MNQKLKLIYTLISLVWASALYSQSLSSIIYDEDSKEPLPFCTVGIAGKSIGTVANAEGKFILGSKSIEPGDTLVVSHIGYTSYKQPVSAVPSEIYLATASITLNEVPVFARELQAKDIIQKIEENFKKNHAKANEKQRIFLHQFERAKFPNKNQIKIKESDFAGLEPAILEELIDKLPSQFVEYKDVLAEIYRQDRETKMIPIDAISLEEQSMMDLATEMEEQFEEFGENIKESLKNEDQYFKFRTGILAFKADMDTTEEDKPDTIQYENKTNYWKSSVNTYQSRYAHIDNDNWEFITKPGKYRYTKGDISIINDELVYQVHFTPKNGGLFEGTIFCSTSTYGVLQVDYSYANGKSNENFHLLGIGHSLADKKVRVLYEHTESGYMLKYINAYEKETASIERGFSFLKKEKRFLWDKTINTLSMDLNLFFDISTQVELLVMDREPISVEQYEVIEQPEKFTFRKEISNSPTIWNNQTVLAPTDELAKYQRSEKSQ